MLSLLYLAMLALLCERAGQGHEHRTATGQEHHEEARGRRQASDLRNKESQLERTDECEAVLQRLARAAAHALTAHLPAS